MLRRAMGGCSGLPLVSGGSSSDAAPQTAQLLSRLHARQPEAASLSDHCLLLCDTPGIALNIECLRPEYESGQDVHSLRMAYLLTIGEPTC